MNFFEPTVTRRDRLRGVFSSSGAYFSLELQPRDAENARKAIAERQLISSTWDKPSKTRPITLTPDLGLLDIGVAKATREEWLARLGAPEFEVEKYRFVAYVKDGPTWFDLLGIENSMQMLGQRYLLFVRFGSDGRTSDYELHSVNPMLGSSFAYTLFAETSVTSDHADMRLHCSLYRYCVAAGGLFARYATAEESRDAKRTYAKDDECLFNIFSDQRNTVWRVSLDEQFAAYLHDAAWPPGFLQWTLPVGKYSITAENLVSGSEATTGQDEPSNQSSSHTKEFLCKARKEYFLRIRIDRKGPRLSLIREDEADVELRRRTLVLSEL